MGCFIELRDSLLRFEFNGKGKPQTILVDMLLKYGEFDITSLASALNASIEDLQNILQGKHFFVGENADNLSHLFLVFFGRTFFDNFTIVRNFFEDATPNEQLISSR